MRPCSVEELASAYAAATRVYRHGPLTVAGRALTKHNPAVRPGSAYPVPLGDPDAVNDLAHEVIGSILFGPNTVLIPRGRIFDIVASDGRGLRFYEDWTFKGLLEPPRETAEGWR